MSVNGDTTVPGATSVSGPTTSPEMTARDTRNVIPLLKVPAVPGGKSHSICTNVAVAAVTRRFCTSRGWAT
eukprot:1560036-Rhodomonas_salina.1